MSYLATTESQRREMLQACGVGRFDQLLAAIPSECLLDRELSIPAASELELMREIEALANANAANLTCFAGAGIYDHFIPAAALTAVMRPEFMTAYTPYQPEVAQGTLQIIYEFQSHICRLTGMDVANASLYDGGSAMAEAVIMATATTGRSKILIAETVNSFHRQVCETYHAARPVEIMTVRRADGQLDIDHLRSLLDDATACVVLAQPNAYGLLEDIRAIEPLVHACGAKLILSIDPIAQIVLTTPGELGVDIVVGEGQPLGIPMSFGGPTFGFFAVKKELIRLLPGRLAARTTDVDGKEGYVLTLQTREQHIRRDKATSNICTNQAFCATMATAYLSLMGKEGMREVALLSMERAQYAVRAISQLSGYSVYWQQPYVREVAIRTPRPAKEIISRLAERHGVLAGVDAGQWDSRLSDCLIVALTEKRTFAEIDQFVSLLGQFTAAAVAEKVA